VVGLVVVGGVGVVGLVGGLFYFSNDLETRFSISLFPIPGKSQKTTEKQQNKPKVWGFVFFVWF